MQTFYSRLNFPLRFTKWSIALAACLLLTGCGPDKPPLQSAPVGDRATLEKLAATYNRISEQLPAPPLKLLPDQRKTFIEQVFQESGYDYAATMHDLALKINRQSDQLVKDMAQLVLLPHANVLQPQSVSKLYSEQELKDVKKIEAALH